MEYKAILIFAMLFFHIIDDFYLQGVLSLMKQEQWWKDNVPNPLYENDYIMALFTHAFSWTVMIHIPVFIYIKMVGSHFNSTSALIFACMWGIHSVVDDCKANRHTINLIQDQCIHIIQIVIVWSYYILY